LSGSRKIWPAVAVLLLAAMLISAGHGGQPSQDKKTQGPAASEDGAQLFSSTCAGCHGLDGRGAERGPNIATRLEVMRRSDSELLTTLKQGIPSRGMPPFEALGEAKLKSLVAHLRSLQGVGKERAVTGDAALGKKLFFGSAKCSSCHMLGGSGGFLASDLGVYGAVTAPAEMREDISGHDRNPRAQQFSISTKDGTQITGFVRNEDNFSVQFQSLDGAFHLLDRANIDGMAPVSNSVGSAKLTGAELDAIVSYLVNAGHDVYVPSNLKKRKKHMEEDED
jgi:cytochrome c oxidase cbb3-type subunit III